jgi:hypothetical protein
VGCRPAKAKLVEVVVGVLEVNLIVVVVVEGVQEGVEGGLTLAEISHRLYLVARDNYVMDIILWTTVHVTRPVQVMGVLTV